MPYLSKNRCEFYKCLFFAVFLCLFCHSFVSAQTKVLQADILKLTSHSDSLIKNYPAEKVYLQLDKPYYAINDTIWFKAYLLNAASLMFSAKSGLLHIDICNDSDKVVKQYLLPVKNGITWGNIALGNKGFKAGAYILHAYTNWMRNFGTDGIFYKSFYIADFSESNWLITQKTSTTRANDKNIVDAQLQFNNLDKIAFGNKPLQFQVISGSKSLYKQKVQTDKDGRIDVNFALPEKAHGLAILAEDKQNKTKAIIPLNVNHPEETDVQFLPEGGSLVAGLPSHVGFKAVGEDGKGVNISGVIFDHEHQQVVSFQSTHNGMGSFYLNVQPGEIYTAQVKLPGGKIKEYLLPAIKTSGTILQVKNVMESDSIDVAIAASEDIAKSNSDLILIGKSRGIICYAAIVGFHEANYIRKKIAKRLFPSGITHFILMTTGEQALNERLVYIDHHDYLQIRVTNSELSYSPRDSVALHLDVTDSRGEPVQGNFSLAVTDDAHIKTDSLNDVNMITRILLTSDLKGYVENPGYYFLSKSKETRQALDNLMLTQGWVGYEPIKSDYPYKAEMEYTVKGRVNNFFNKPVKGTNVILFSKSPTLLMDTVTDREGMFTFRHFPKVDTPIFLLRAVNKNGKSFNVNINVIEPPLPMFNIPQIPLQTPWYVNSDSSLMNYVKDDIAYKKMLEYTPDGKHHLKEVVITAKKTIKDSQNLNGPGNADMVIDEKELEAAGKKTYLQLLEERVKGFREVVYFAHDTFRIKYLIKHFRVIFIIDGIKLSNVIPVDSTAYEYRNYLQSHNAEDIKGIEVNFSGKFSDFYYLRFVDPFDTKEYAFIEITTRSGHGPIVSNTPGMYLYKPLVISWPKQFYKPRYTVTDTTRYTELRSTIDWEPNVITDEYGKATIWFYAGEKPSTYTVVVEGADYYGNLGYKRQKMIISGKKPAEKSK